MAQEIRWALRVTKILGHEEENNCPLKIGCEDE
jgi:hypothetical protein